MLFRSWTQVSTSVLFVLAVQCSTCRSVDKPPGELSYVAIMFPKILNLWIHTQQWHMLLITEDCFADQEVMANTCIKMTALTWDNLVPGTPLTLLNNTTYTWDPCVLYIIAYMMLDKYAVAHQVQFVQLKVEYLFLSLTACIQYVAPNGINSVLHAT